MADAGILPSPCDTEYRGDLLSPVGNVVQGGGGLVGWWLRSPVLIRGIRFVRA